MTLVDSQVVPAVSPSFAGIDLAKDKLDLARSDCRELLTVANDEQGIGRILQLFKTTPPACIVVEATGGLEIPLVSALLDARTRRNAEAGEIAKN
jgi:transposase